MKPLASTRLERGRLTVHVWRNSRDVTRADRKVDGSTKGLTVYGFCLHNGKTAEIHLSKEDLTDELWEHEKQHYLLGECARRNWRLGMVTEPNWEEPLARMAGRLTKQFWSWFDKRFPNG